MISPMRYRVTFKECNMLHLHRFLVCMLPLILSIMKTFTLMNNLQYPPLFNGAMDMPSTHILDDIL